MKLDVLAIGAHPDDVELACGGTLAKLAEEGRAIGILHLSRGEAASRGTPEEREREATKAAEALGVQIVDFLSCGDGSLRTGVEEEDAVIAKIREWSPRLILGPAASDRHPDHGRAHQLVEASAFYAGLASRSTGEPHRPAALFSYMQHDPFEPSFLVDVTATWDRKIEALREYRSQLYQDDRDDEGTPTKVASREYWRAVEGRARHFGQLISCEFAEPFWSRLPLAVSDVLAVLPKGLP